MKKKLIGAMVMWAEKKLILWVVENVLLVGECLVLYGDALFRQGMLQELNKLR